LFIFVGERGGGGGAERLKNLLKVIKMINFHYIKIKKKEGIS